MTQNKLICTITYFFAIALMINCKIDGNRIHVESKLDIDFNIDSFKIIQIPTNTLGFIFSPLDSSNIVWLNLDSNPQELNLLSGVITSLSTKYNTSFYKGISENTIWLSKKDNEIFIGTSDALFCFPRYLDTFYKYPIRVQDILNSPMHILACSGSGLFEIDKYSGQICSNHNFNETGWLHSMVKLNDTTITFNKNEYSLNGRYFEYNNNLYALKSISTSRNSANVDLPVGIEGSSYTTLSDSNMNSTWCFNNNYLYFKDSANNYLNCKLLPLSNLRQVNFDANYLYLLSEGNFTIIDKKYLLDHSISFNYAKYKKEQQEFESIVHKFYEANIDSAIILIQLIKSSLVYKNDTSIRQRFNQEVEYYFSSIYTQSKILDFESHIKLKTLENEYLPLAYYGLCKYYTRNFNLTKAVSYIELLKSISPNINLLNSQLIFPRIVKIKYSLDSLIGLNLERAEFLYKESKIKENLILSCDDWFGSTIYDNSIVLKNMKVIVSQFPNSEFADNARYYLIIDEYNEKEGGDQYSAEAVKQFQKFIIKYPNSELIPDAIIQITDNYCNYNGNENDMIKYRYLALDELDKLPMQFASNELVKIEFEALKTQIMRSIIKLKFSFYITTNSNICANNLTFQVCLQNKTSKVEGFEIFSEISPFITSLFSRSKCIYSEDHESTNNKTKVVSINPLETICYAVNLFENVRSWDNRIQAINILKPDTYYLNFYLPNKSLETDQFMFIIN